MKTREDKFDVVVIAGKLYVHRRGFFEKLKETYKMSVPTVTVGQWRFAKYDWRDLKNAKA